LQRGPQRIAIYLPGSRRLPFRFRHLRHTTASLLLMSGADLAAVQRIMRHQDPRMTTDFYGHLATNPRWTPQIRPLMDS